MNQSSGKILKNLIDITGGRLIHGNPKEKLPPICIDSRKIAPNDLFVAIKGEVFDGHDFLADAVEKGAGGLIIEEGKMKGLSFELLKEKNVFCILVNNTLAALGKMGEWFLRQSNCRVVAITGSNGKTTTREMIASVLSGHFNLLTPDKNFNNEVGLPLTLFRLKPEHEIAVLELGMNHPGEIRRLAKICHPDVGVITNIAPAHLGGVGSLEGVMNAKGELLEELKPEAFAILNADDPMVVRLSQRIDKKTILYGLSAEAHIRASSIEGDGKQITFRLHLPDAQKTVTLSVCGAFMVRNALAAAAVGWETGLSPDEIAQGLHEFEPVAGRLKRLELSNGAIVIDDTYNANPASMAVALETLKKLKKDKRGIAVLGDMLELGADSASLHQKVGNAVGDSGADMLFATGNFAQTCADGAKEKGLSPGKIFTGSKEEILTELKQKIQPGDCILIKGSRGMKMEQIVNGLSGSSKE